MSRFKRSEMRFYLTRSSLSSFCDVLDLRAQPLALSGSRDAVLSVSKRLSAFMHLELYKVGFAKIERERRSESTVSVTVSLYAY